MLAAHFHHPRLLSKPVCHIRLTPVQLSVIETSYEASSALVFGANSLDALGELIRLSLPAHAVPNRADEAILSNSAPSMTRAE